MSKYPALESKHEINGEALVENILRKDTPGRAHHMELFHDGEISNAIIERYDLAKDLDENDPDYHRKRYIAFMRFLGFDYVSVGIAYSTDMKLRSCLTEDTAAQRRESGRSYQDEHSGPIMSWEDFEKFEWPNSEAPEAAAELEWYQENLPDDMCIVAWAGGHFAEYMAWLMGYEALCFALYDQRDLVKAIEEKLREMFRVTVKKILQFDRVKMVWASDDMGFKTQPLVSPDDVREFFLPGHKELAAMAHAAGRPYLLHSCGKLLSVMDDLIDDVQIDAKHSFEDTIEDVREVKQSYGQRIAMIGGIDVDFLCRADEQTIRKRVRETLDICMPGGGYCLGTGNTVANYIPLDNYLAMVDEGWRWIS